MTTESNQRIQAVQKQLEEFVQTTQKERQTLLKQHEEDKKSLEDRLKNERMA